VCGIVVGADFSNFSSSSFRTVTLGGLWLLALISPQAPSPGDTFPLVYLLFEGQCGLPTAPLYLLVALSRTTYTGSLLFA
jgi:hypothetical protein